LTASLAIADDKGVALRAVSAANLQARCERRGATLLPILRRPISYAVRIVLAQELAGPRAAEVTFALKVIDARWEVTPYKPITGAGHARGRIMAYGLGESWRPRYQDEGGERSQCRGHKVTHLAPAGRASPEANCASKLRLKLAAARICLRARIPVERIPRGGRWDDESGIQKKPLNLAARRELCDQTRGRSRIASLEETKPE
jgi:hypothetical protein